MAPVCGKDEEGQHLIELALEFLDHVRCTPPPTRTEPACPLPCLRFAFGIPDPPKLPAKLAALKPSQPRRQRFQLAEPMCQTQLVPGRRIHRLYGTPHRRQSVTHDQ